MFFWLLHASNTMPQVPEVLVNLCDVPSNLSSWLDFIYYNRAKAFNPCFLFLLGIASHIFLFAWSVWHIVMLNMSQSLYRSCLNRMEVITNICKSFCSFLTALLLFGALLLSIFSSRNHIRTIMQILWALSCAIWIMHCGSLVAFACYFT